jgi:hypothetical protein
MAGKTRQVRWIIGIGAIVFVGILIASSFHQTKIEYEVCVNFKGGSHCATATGSTEEEAIRTSHDIDCEFLAQGRDEIMACGEIAARSARKIR